MAKRTCPGGCMAGIPKGIKLDDKRTAKKVNLGNGLITQDKRGMNQRSIPDSRFKPRG